MNNLPKFNYYSLYDYNVDVIILPKISVIYCIFNTSNGKFYIGSTKNFYKRIGDHKRNLQNQKHFNIHLQNSFNYYGESNFKILIVELCPENILLYREQYYLDSLLPNYNMSKISSSPMKGRKHTEITKEKMRIKSKGRIYLQEFRDKISKSKKGIKKKPESVEKMRNKLTGRKRSQESIEKTVSTKKKNWDIGKFNKGKLTIDEILKLRKMKTDGFDIKDIYKEFSQISERTVRDIINFHTWKFVK